MKITEIIIKTLIVASAITIITGCATTGIPGDNSVNIKVLDDKNFSINNMIYPKKELPKRLKKMGANSETEIFLKLPEDSTTYMMKSYGSILKQNNFGRYFFTHGQKTTATIKEK
jgi:hypothetical protein